MKYAEKFIRYKDIVEVEYSSNYMNSDSLVKVLRASPGLYCVHYSVEPATLSLNQYGSRFSTALRLSGILKGRSGRVIHQFDKPFTLEFDDREMERIRALPYAIYDVFPLIPDFIEMGVDILNPIQTSAGKMSNLTELKKQFGKNLVFCGAIDTHGVLPFGTTDEVRAEVKRIIDVLGKDGVYLAASVHTIMSDVPPENVAAMARAAKETWL